MSTQVHESVPTFWLDDRDVPFFGLTAGLFNPSFTDGAGVLLASYDDEPADWASFALGVDAEATRNATATTSHHQPATAKHR
jgi:hypothetical protein